MLIYSISLFYFVCETITVHSIKVIALELVYEVVIRVGGTDINDFSNNMCYVTNCCFN